MFRDMDIRAGETVLKYGEIYVPMGITSYDKLSMGDAIILTHHGYTFICNKLD